MGVSLNMHRPPSVCVCVCVRGCGWVEKNTPDSHTTHTTTFLLCQPHSLYYKIKHLRSLTYLSNHCSSRPSRYHLRIMDMSTVPQVPCLPSHVSTVLEENPNFLSLSPFAPVRFSPPGNVPAFPQVPPPVSVEPPVVRRVKMRPNVPQQLTLYCARCEYTFDNQEAFDKHTEKHLIGKHFLCHICCRMMTQKINRKVHMLTHNKDTPRFPCPECDLSFTTDGNLRKHVRKHTGWQVTCDGCGWVGTGDMARHKRSLTCQGKTRARFAPY